MRFIDDQRELLAFQRIRPVKVAHPAKLLQRAHNDLRPTGQRGDELPGVLVDLLHQPGRLLELLHRLL